MKIIQILNHSLSNNNQNVDPRFYEDDWHVKVAKGIIKETNEYEIECWRPEKSLNKMYSRTGNDGIVYKLFPSKYLSKIEYSPLMLKELKELIEKSKVLLHFHGIFYPSTYYLLKNVPNNVPIIAQSHASSPTIIRALFNHNPLKYFEFVELLYQKKYFKKIDEFFCLSSEEVKEFSKYGNAIIQPMGINFDIFKPIKKETALNNLKLKKKNYVLYVGRIHKIKGLNFLIKGLKDILPKYNLDLLIVGEGPYKSELLSLINKLGIYDYVKFLGFIKNEELIYLYNIADVTISPSLWEAYPVVPMESLACKTPLITTDVGSVSEIMKHFKGGYKIIPKRNSDAITNAFYEMKSKNFDKSKIDREGAKKYHDWKTIINNTIRIYNKLEDKYYK
jgi:glycosyltransferase involved in cell wall biosynthesis